MKIIKYLYLFPISIIFFSCSATKVGTEHNESYYNDIFCNKVKGEREVRHYYSGGSYILVDCETYEYVYEGGKDKRSSLDSIQQAVFSSILTGKKPAVVIFNTDNKIGKYEYRIKSVADKLNIKFILEEEINGGSLK